MYCPNQPFNICLKDNTYNANEAINTLLAYYCCIFSNNLFGKNNNIQMSEIDK